MKTKEILDSAFNGADGSFSFGREYHSGLNSGVLTGLDYSTGIKLSNLVGEINSKTGLEVGLFNGSTLRWCRKGEGFVAPANTGNSTPRSTGMAITSTDTRIRVVGDRIRYQKLNIDLEPDWSQAWNPYIEEVAFLRALGGGSGSTEVGALLLSARARTITVAEFAAIAGAGLMDSRRFGGVSRNQIPAWTYLHELVYRSYRIPESFTLEGLPLSSLDLTDLIQATDVAGSSQVLSSPPRYYPRAQASAIARGQPLDLINSHDIREFYKTIGGDYSNTWNGAPDFEVDAMGKSIRFSVPTFIDGAGASSIYLCPNSGASGDYAEIAVPNPNFLITPAQVKASFCFLLGRYYKDFGSGNRYGSIASGGLDQHLVDGREVLYADGGSASTRAREIASCALELDPFQLSGGYTVHGAAGTELSACVDRVTVLITSDGGVTEQVEFTKARASGAAFSERTLQRIQRSEELFSGQEALKRESREYRLLAAAVSNPSVTRRSRNHARLSDVFNQTVGCSAVSTTIVANTGGPWTAGDVVWLDGSGCPTSEGGAVFGGVVVASPGAAASMLLAYTGRVPVKVDTGIPVNGSIMGTVGESKGSAAGSVIIGRLAHGSPTPGTSGTLLAMVDLGVGAGGGDAMGHPFQGYKSAGGVKIRTGFLYKGLGTKDEKYDIDSLETELELVLGTVVWLELTINADGHTVDSAIITSSDGLGDDKGERLFFSETNAMLQTFASVPVGYVVEGGMPAGRRGFSFSMKKAGEGGSEEDVAYSFVQELETHLMMASWVDDGKAVVYPVEAK
jgi:hypothetical protein